MLEILLYVIALATGAPEMAQGPAKAEPNTAPAAVATAVPLSDTTEAKSFTSAEDLPPGAEPEPDVVTSPYTAEQQVATGRFLTALEVKPILSATRSSWVAVRDYDGQDLVYTTHLWAWRCGLVALHVGINGATPEPWPLPDCHEETNSPNAILPEDGLPYRAFAPGSIETITVELIYDDLSTERVTFNRQGALLP